MYPYGNRKLDPVPIQDALSDPSKAEQLIGSAKKIVDDDPERKSALLFLGFLLKEAIAPHGRPDIASRAKEHPHFSTMIDTFDKLVQLDSEEPTHYWNRAMVRQSLGLYEIAIGDLVLFLELVRPKHAGDEEDFRTWVASAYNHLGFSLLQVGRIDAAIAPLEKAVELHPSYRSGWEDLSRAYVALGNWEKAVACRGHAAKLTEKVFD